MKGVNLSPSSGSTFDTTEKQRPFMNLKQKIVVILTDILLLAELCISMYLCSQETPENLTPTFLKTFPLMCVTTLIAAKIAIKRLRSPEDPGAFAGADAALVKE